MNSLDVARNKIKDLVPETAAKMQISTHNAEAIIDQIVFELLKEVFVYECKETKNDEKKSLNQISGIGNEADLKRHSRKMQYSNYYRKELSERMKREYDFSSPELDIKDMSALGKRHPGYQLSRYDIEQLEAMENLVLLNNIVNRRITFDFII